MRKTTTVHAARVEPGVMRYYTLDELKGPAGEANWHDWGICEYDRQLWVGDRVSIEGRDVMRLSLLEILERRDDEYPDWGDEETYVLLGLDKQGAFSWFLLNKKEFKKSEGMVYDVH